MVVVAILASFFFTWNFVPDSVMGNLVKCPTKRKSGTDFNYNK